MAKEEANVLVKTIGKKQDRIDELEGMQKSSQAQDKSTTPSSKEVPEIPEQPIEEPKILYKSNESPEWVPRQNVFLEGKFVKQTKPY